MRHFDLEQAAQRIVDRKASLTVGVEAGDECAGDNEAKPKAAGFLGKRPKGGEPLDLGGAGAPAFVERTGELR